MNMGLQETLNYVVFANPLSIGAYGLAKNAVNGVSSYIGLVPKAPAEMVNADPIPLWKLAASTGPFVRLAAISGAVAVILGAYGSHRKYPKDTAAENMKVFDTATRYHFVHTLALLGLPMCRAPYVAGLFMVSGIILFSGSCYYYAFTNNKRFSRVTPIGGTCFILGWIAMLY